jgi:hypothetical protein
MPVAAPTVPAPPVAAVATVAPRAGEPTIDARIAALEARVARLEER